MTVDDKDKPIEKLQHENAVLRRRLEELERRLGINSTNSSKPPSSDPPDAPRKPPRRKRKQRGAKKALWPNLT